MSIVECLEYIRNKSVKITAIPKEYDQPELDLTEKDRREKCRYSWAKWDRENKESKRK